MTEEDARQAVKDFRTQYPEMASGWDDEAELMLRAYEDPRLNTRTAWTQPDVPKSSSINSRIFSRGAASALAVFLMVVWTEFGLLATAGTLVVVLAALLVWAAKKFKELVKVQGTGERGFE